METMKFRTLALLSVALFSLAACSTTSDLGRSDRMDRDAIEIDNPLDLKDFLVRAGVSFDFNTGVPLIRGGEPLYVVDGVRLGHNYYSVARSINVNDIQSVEVIKNAGQGLIYGRDSGNGVIVIKTKTGV